MTPKECALSFCSSGPNLSWLYYRKREAGWNEPRRLCHESKTQPPQTWQTFPKQSVSTLSGRSLSFRSLVFLTLLGLLLCCQKVEAGPANSGHQWRRRHQLLFDKHDPSIARMGFEIDLEIALQPRNDPSEPSSPDSNRDETIPHSQTPLPTPFDASLGNNFTAPNCPAFFESFLHNTSFQDCVPLSLLLQTSSAFFTVSHSFIELTETLDATCNVDYQHCSSLMSSLAEQIQSKENCAADLEMQNPIVEQAYNGFMAYQPLYHAGCLKNSSGDYCFANAMTNTSAPSSSFIYYLPLGVPLPGSSQPSCNECLQNTMDVFKAYASGADQALGSDYGAAAQQIDTTCGSHFARTYVQMSSTAQPAPRAVGLGSLGLLIALLHLFFG